MPLINGNGPKFCPVKFSPFVKSYEIKSNSPPPVSYFVIKQDGTFVIKQDGTSVIKSGST
jgi:hypothetical protein